MNWKRLGIKYVGGDNDLFGEDDSWKARFLIGGRIIKLGFNTFGPLAGKYSESIYTVAWEVYDKQQRRTITPPHKKC